MQHRLRQFGRFGCGARGDIDHQCIEPARVFVNDRVLPWPNGRFGLCSRCVRPATPLWRIARRREIRQDAGKLRHVLQRITVVRRELGYVCTATAARHRLRRAS